MSQRARASTNLTLATVEELQVARSSYYTYALWRLFCIVLLVFTELLFTSVIWRLSSIGVVQPVKNECCCADGAKMCRAPDKSSPPKWPTPNVLQLSHLFIMSKGFCHKYAHHSSFSDMWNQISNWNFRETLSYLRWTIADLNLFVEYMKICCS